jgi:hypothetical protein
MVFIFGIAPLLAGAYLAYSIANLRQVKIPIYSGQNRRFLNHLSFVALGLFVLLLVVLIVSKDIGEIFIALALCITAVVAIIQFRVSIGENGIYLKLRFRPWSEFNGYRWKKMIHKAYWILYLYQVDSVEIIGITIPENQVSRLDLILQNKIGMLYQGE